MKLNQHQRSVIEHALRVAAMQFDEDAKGFAASDNPVVKPLAREFETYAKNARQVLDYVEEQEDE